jgi:hypothetical protein
MRKFVLLAVALVAVVGAGVAYSAASPSAKLDKQDRLWGGGHWSSGCAINDPSTCITNGRNVAVDAHAAGDGSGAAGNSAYASSPSRSVTCLNVQGDKAAIGGVLTSGDNVGFGYVQYFVDQGTTSLTSPQHDLGSLSLIAPLDDPSFPAGFPTVCPPAGGSQALPAFYFELDGGDLTVQDAPAS